MEEELVAGDYLSHGVKAEIAKCSSDDGHIIFLREPGSGDRRIVISPHTLHAIGEQQYCLRNARARAWTENHRVAGFDSTREVRSAANRRCTVKKIENHAQVARQIREGLDCFLELHVSCREEVLWGATVSGEL